MKHLIRIAALAAVLALPTIADAQQRQILTGNPARDLAAARAAATGSPTSVAADSNVMAALAKPFQDLAAFIKSDAQGAITLSTQISALQDGHGQQCWIAMSTAGDVFNAHPVPLTLKAMTDLEALRLLEVATNNLCSNVHCTQVFADLSALAQAVSPIPLAIPTLHDLCGKIPQVALVAPVTYTPPTTPAPATPATATPEPAAPAKP